MVRVVGRQGHGAREGARAWMLPVSRPMSKRRRPSGLLARRPLVRWDAMAARVPKPPASNSLAPGAAVPGVAMKLCSSKMALETTTGQDKDLNGLVVVPGLGLLGEF